MHAREQLSLGGGSRYFRAFLDALTDAVVIADEHLLVWGYNDAAERLFGHAPADVVGRPIAQLMPTDHWRAGEASGAAAAPGTPSRRAVEGRRKNGSAYHCELGLTSFVVDGRRYLVGVARELPAPCLSARGIAGEPLQDAV
jgi:PAS domain S-box-containing protein